MTRKLYNSVSDLKASSKKTRLFGRLGIPLNGYKTVEVAGRGGFVYVRLRENTSEVVQAFNEKVSPIYDLPVEIERDGNIYYVVGRDVETYSNWGNFTPFFPRHGWTHSFDPYFGSGGDVVWVWGRQFAPMLIVPSGQGGPNLYILDYTMLTTNGTWISVGNTGTSNLLTYKPTGADAVIGMVTINRQDGGIRLLINSGSHAPAFATGTMDIAPYLPSIEDSHLIPAGAFRLVSGTSSIYWNNLYDIRQYFNEGPERAASETIFFLTSGSSGVNGFDLMVTSRPTGTYNYYSASISATGTLLADFITDANVPNASFITDGIYHLHIHAVKTAGTKDARLRYYFGKRSAGGTETTLHTSELSGLIPTTEVEIDMESFELEHGLETSDRLWNRIYGYQDGLGTAPTVQLKIEGDTLSRFEIPTTASETSGGSPGGSNTQIQFNDGGVFGGDADFTWNKTTNVMTMGLASFNVSGLSTSRTFTYPDRAGTIALTSDLAGYLTGSYTLLDGRYQGTGTISTQGFITGSYQLLDGRFLPTGSAIPNDGWIAISATWTRTGNYTFTVSGDVTATYRKGAFVRYKDGGAYEYGVIQSSSYSAPNTTVTLITNSDYAMAAATITDTYISYVVNPDGWPGWFAFTSTPGGFSANPTFTMQWSVVGKTCFINLNATANGTSNSTAHNYSLPVASIAANFQSTGLGVNNGANVAITTFINAGATTLDIFVSPLSNWTASGNKSANTSLFYGF